MCATVKKRTATEIRCVPRYGFAETEVRTVDLDLPACDDAFALRDALDFFFSSHGISDAVYAVEVDDDGYFAVINDEAYEHAWGRPLL